MFSWLTDTGRFKDDDFQDDLDKLRDFYRENGYLDVEIPEEKIVFSYPKQDGLVITIAVVEGRQYHIGEITFTGNKLHSTLLLKRVAALYAKPGTVFAPSKIDKAVGAPRGLLRQGRLPGDARPRDPQAEPQDQRHRHRVQDRREREVQRRVDRDRGQHEDEERRHHARAGPRARRRLRHGPG